MLTDKRLNSLLRKHTVLHLAVSNFLVTRGPSASHLQNMLYLQPSHCWGLIAGVSLTRFFSWTVCSEHSYGKHSYEWGRGVRSRARWFCSPACRITSETIELNLEDVSDIFSISTVSSRRGGVATTSPTATINSSGSWVFTGPFSTSEWFGYTHWRLKTPQFQCWWVFSMVTTLENSPSCFLFKMWTPFLASWMVHGRSTAAPAALGF